MNTEKAAVKEEELTIESLLDRIDRIYDGLAPAQQKAIIFIRKKWEQICMLTAKEVGQKAEVSEATIQRIAVCLGFKSFRDMKIKMRSLIKNRAVVNFKLKDEGQTGKAGWLEAHVNAEVSNIVATFHLNTGEAFTAGAGLLIRSGRIWVLGDKMGSGASAYLSFCLNYLIGKTVLLNHSNCDEYISFMDQGDTLIVVGFQRYSQKTLKAAGLAKGRGARILAFTDCDLSPFAKLADIAFYALTDSVVFLDSYSPVLSLCHALISAVVHLDQGNIRRHIESTEQVYAALS